MPNQQLLDYIQKAKEAGQTDWQITQSLLQIGWSQEQINEAFGTSSTQTIPVRHPIR